MHSTPDCLRLHCGLKGRAALVVSNERAYSLNDFRNRLMIKSAYANVKSCAQTG